MQKTWRTTAQCASTEDREGKNGYVSITSLGNIAKSLSLELSRYVLQLVREHARVSGNELLVCDSSPIVHLLADGISSLSIVKIDYFFITSGAAIFCMSMQNEVIMNRVGGNWTYTVPNHMSLLNFTAATYFVYTLQQGFTIFSLLQAAKTCCKCTNGRH